MKDNDNSFWVFDSHGVKKNLKMSQKLHKSEAKIMLF